uniref:Testicular haploid expressed gene protein-like n=1 Tax=Ciona intestinalis TaxID=7719 RepID=F6YJN9_CIOIN|nr:testicular haploid expressed gene protein-like isoform X1 [Ciona intestinalis]|eukprot:XP_009861409.1 testicular haploid expressed gene protein-like isoform X1 [Ciona intestinalis]
MTQISNAAPVSISQRILPTSAHGRHLPRGYSRQRILSLSKAKESKQVWLTSFGPKLYWGDQDMMWPISPQTLNARPTQRLMQLAASKRNFQFGTKQVNRPEFVYSCGRNSQIWEVNKSAMKATASDRSATLAQPKQAPPQYQEHRHNHQYSCGRVSPIWKVDQAALRCPSRPRTAQLAKPKQPHLLYVPNSEVETLIKPTALTGSCPERVSDLARPKSRGDGPFIDSRSPEDTIWKVQGAARAATASPRLLELSKCKGFADGYQSNRSVQWAVSRAAKKALAAERTSQLAAPIIRASMDHVQFNPDAFLVSPLAMKARCTPRLEELSHPIQR